VPAFVVEMELRIDVAGEVVERQELLNGTQSVTLEGTSADGGWTATAALSWNLGLVDFAGEGDLTLVRRDGTEIFATLTAARVAEPTADDPDADHAFAASYDIDGGAGRFAEAAGSAEAAGTLAGDTFRATWTLRLTTP
jgi:hypothetical protein